MHPNSAPGSCWRSGSISASTPSPSGCMTCGARLQGRNGSEGGGGGWSACGRRAGVGAVGGRVAAERTRGAKVRLQTAGSPALCRQHARRQRISLGTSTHVQGRLCNQIRAARRVGTGSARRDGAAAGALAVPQSSGPTVSTAEATDPAATASPFPPCFQHTLRVCSPQPGTWRIPAC